MAAGLALVQALVLRRSAMSPAEIVLLARRNSCALVAAGVTMFSAGAALPGHGSVVGLVAGPALACIALVAVLRTRALARRLDRSGTLAVRPPLTDLGRLVRLPVPSLDSRRLLLLTTCLAAAAAFLRDRVERGTVSEAFVTAGIEGMAVVGGASWCSARRSAFGAADGRAPASAEPRWVREEAVERSAARRAAPPSGGMPSAFSIVRRTP